MFINNLIAKSKNTATTTGKVLVGFFIVLGDNGVHILQSFRSTLDGNKALVVSEVRVNKI
jgi:hypothetical protein